MPPQGRRGCGNGARKDRHEGSTRLLWQHKEEEARRQHEVVVATMSMAEKVERVGEGRTGQG